MRMIHLTVLALITFAPASHAKEVAKRSVPASKIVAYFKNKPLSESQEATVKLAEVAHAAFGASVALPYGKDEEESIQFASPNAVAGAINAEIEGQSNWNEKLSPKKLAVIRKNDAALKAELGSPSYAYSWFLVKLGKKEEAQKALLEAFEKEFDRVMQLKDAVYFHRGPLDFAEIQVKALQQFKLPESSKADVDAKMQKMKVHVSNLPQHMIKT